MRHGLRHAMPGLLQRKWQAEALENLASITLEYYLIGFFVGALFGHSKRSRFFKKFDWPMERGIILLGTDASHREI